MRRTTGEEVESVYRNVQVEQSRVSTSGEQWEGTAGSVEVDVEAEGAVDFVER